MATTSVPVRQLRELGYAIVPDFLSAEDLSAWRSVVAGYLAQDPPAADRTGPYFLWPELTSDTGQLRTLYRKCDIAEIVNEFLRPDLLLEEPERAQLAITLPPHPHRPGAPHIDGLTPTEADGRPGTFTLLAGLLLTDQRQEDRGNLWVWPGTHLKTGEWLRKRGPDALRTAVPYPPVELSEPVQLTAAAGSLVLVHYLLAHNIGGHFGTSDQERRETVYFRLHASGHRSRWREVVTDPLVEFSEC